MFNENFLYALVIMTLAMFMGTTLVVGLVYILYKFFRNISPFSEPVKKIRNIITVLGNIEEMNKTYETLKYANSTSVELYSRLNLICEKLEKIEQKTLGEVFQENEEISEEEKVKSIMDYSENLFNESLDDFIREKSISKDNILYQAEIERSISEDYESSISVDSLGYSDEDYNYIHETLTSETSEKEYFDDETDESPFIEKSIHVRDNEIPEFIESTITVHEDEPVVYEAFQNSSYEDRKKYIDKLLREKNEEPKNIPKKDKKDLLVKMHKFCTDKENEFADNKIVEINKDSTGRYNFGFQNPVEKIYMDHKRNESNIYLV